MLIRTIYELQKHKASGHNTRNEPSAFLRFTRYFSEAADVLLLHLHHVSSLLLHGPQGLGALPEMPIHSCNARDRFYMQEDPGSPLSASSTPCTLSISIG